MIRSGIFTLQEVAQSCGFRNEYYFSRVFKQYTGTPPGKY
jgi:AraC-like DNA-binding protein